jgi:hypothetical protein
VSVLRSRRRNQLQQMSLVIDVNLSRRPVWQSEGPLALRGRDHAQTVRLMGPELLIVDEIEQLFLDFVVVTAWQFGSLSDLGHGLVRQVAKYDSIGRGILAERSGGQVNGDDGWGVDRCQQTQFALTRDIQMPHASHVL